jgi:hypothetical protein
MSTEINSERRHFFGTAAMTFAAAQLGMVALGDAQPGNEKGGNLPPIKSGTNTSFASLKKIDAGLLNVTYAEAGPSDGRPVVLLHGWPYDIYSFVEVAQATRNIATILRSSSGLSLHRNGISLMRPSIVPLHLSTTQITSGS